MDSVWVFMLRGHRDPQRNLVAGRAALVPKSLADAFKKLNPPAARDATATEVSYARKKRRVPEEVERPRQLKLEPEAPEDDPGDGDDSGESGEGEGEGAGEGSGEEKPEGGKRKRKWAQIPGATGEK